FGRSREDSGGGRGATRQAGRAAVLPAAALEDGVVRTSVVVQDRGRGSSPQVSQVQGKISSKNARKVFPGTMLSFSFGSSNKRAWAGACTRACTRVKDRSRAFAILPAPRSMGI